MAEELRFFLRTAVYAVLIGAVYWFVSYEVAGSVLLAFVVLATLAFVAVAGVFARRAPRQVVPHDGSPWSRAGRLVNRLLGFEEPRGAAAEPLAAGLEPIPTASIWPPIAGVAALVSLLGLVYGPWLLLPGVVLSAGCVWGWITQLDPR
jgi:hypothetical protein